MWKWMAIFWRKNNLLRRWGWLSLLNWIGALTLSLLLKLLPRKLEPSLVLWNFFLLRLLCISINPPYSHVWNTVFTSGPVLLVATCICWISYKNGYAGPSPASPSELLGSSPTLLQRSLFLNRFPVFLNIYVFLFYQTPSLVVSVIYPTAQKPIFENWKYSL